jgi:hypothetical protein
MPTCFVANLAVSGSRSLNRSKNSHRFASRTWVRELSEFDRSRFGRCQSCLLEEQQLRQWFQFAPADRPNCQRVKQTAGAPSYVELLICLQIAAAVKKVPNSELRSVFDLP